MLNAPVEGIGVRLGLNGYRGIECAVADVGDGCGQRDALQRAVGKRLTADGLQRIRQLNAAQSGILERTGADYRDLIRNGHVCQRRIAHEGFFFNHRQGGRQNRSLRACNRRADRYQQNAKTGTPIFAGCRGILLAERVKQLWQEFFAHADAGIADRKAERGLTAKSGGFFEHEDDTAS